MVEIKRLAKPPEWVAKKRGRKGRLPFRALEIGQLCVIPVDERTAKDFRSFRAVVYTTGKRLGHELTCRQLEDGTWEVYRSK